MIARTPSINSSKPLFHSPHRLIVGNAPLVGVLDLPGTIQRPPIRLFFPANTATTTTRRIPKPASYFVDNRVAYVIQGFAHLAIARHTTKFYRWILRPFCWLLSLIFPARFLKLPGTAHVRNEDDAAAVRYAPPSSLALKKKNGLAEDNDDVKDTQQQTQSLVVFSHGLTGTGEENSIFCTALAKKGYVVASIHHRDGSSCRVPLPDGTCRYYEHLPSGDDYDPKFRLEQVHERAQEFLYTCSWMMGDEGLDKNESYEEQQRIVLDQIRPHLDKQKLIAAGFSYGSATVSLAATLAPTKFQCALLLDPWLHVDFSSKGYEFDFPPEAFGANWPQSSLAPKSEVARAGGDSDIKKIGLNVPSLFINSAQFAGYKKLFEATKRLAGRINSHNNDKDESQSPRAEMHVIPGTAHQNFCDTIFWLPWRLSKRVFQLGDADAYDAYEAILNKTVKFLERF